MKNNLLEFILLILMILSIITFFHFLNEQPKKIEVNIYQELKKYKKEYSKIELVNFFEEKVSKNQILNFGYICPGAVKTINYLSKYNSIKPTFIKIRDLTDFQFFIEIITIYNQYLDKEIYENIKIKLDGKECELSKLITSEITKLFNSLPKKIRKDIPDNFYHVRHNTLICSNDKNLALERIKLIKNIYKNESKEDFQNIEICEGKRDGVSGCRDCCSVFQGDEYFNCVNNCMNN